MAAPAVLTAAATSSGSAMWYLTRATGLVAFVLLSATVVLGIVASIGWTRERWPRFLSQALHRNLSLYCLVVIAVHIVTTVADGFVSIGFLNAVVPFTSPYRPIWVGLGALAFDLLLAVAITSALRHRIGYGAWRGIHWLAYVCWPIALFHGLGTGSDARQSVADLLYVVCILAVAGAVVWRLVAVPRPSAGWRLLAGLGTAAIVIATVAFAALGPLRPGWSARAASAATALPTGPTEAVAVTGSAATTAVRTTAVHTHSAGPTSVSGSSGTGGTR